jgi:glutamate N-acetyltransferase/amino-acid N-acetyltransferase
MSGVPSGPADVTSTSGVPIMADQAGAAAVAGLAVDATGAGLTALATDLPRAEERAVMPAGFRAMGAAIGIKPSGRPDFGVIATTGGPAAAAGVFTRNAFAAAPVRLTRAHLARTGGDGPAGSGWADALLSTAGSANAATGATGDADQGALAERLASALGTRAERTLAFSTGVIGTRLPVDLVAAAIADNVPDHLSTSDEALVAAARALMTTDTRPKWAAVRLSLPGIGGSDVPVVVCGIAKGVGMIHPRMATMLAVILTDAATDPATLHGMLRGATTRTWDQLSVDGDTSTNDSVLVLASGASGAEPVHADSPGAHALGRAIEAVARSLARQQAADGEGATTLITCQVTGARDDVDARAVARAVISSTLVKAAVNGKDPNWGRIAGAAGNAQAAESWILEAAGLVPADAASRAGMPVPVEPDRLRITVAGFPVFAGAPLPFDRGAARQAMSADDVLIRLDLGAGNGSGEAFGCDLTEAYVRENAEYTT